MESLRWKRECVRRGCDWVWGFCGILKGVDELYAYAWVMGDEEVAWVLEGVICGKDEGLSPTHMRKMARICVGGWERMKWVEGAVERACLGVARTPRCGWGRGEVSKWGLKGMPRRSMDA
ncbi:hypothetical protein PIB30_074633 [Stylosanthes scabra]|uniref:Uncharacterized protein n=1 Tax=Stylosanthes scabra TaxID=79078 RepID=A0ABU6US22_9FABA|nr:hypothetical protein [Stylosanthes scabra]